MFTTFALNNYRGFSELELSGLGRVNLLVGANNSGKTSILEEFRPLGGNETRKFDVRVVAATKRDINELLGSQHPSLW